MNLPKNTLYIVSTPIGNLEDITLRAINILKNSDIILCEDTRRSLKLFNHLKINKKLISYHKFSERKKFLKIIEYLKGGKTLSLISDAGTPLLSDPGRLLLNECIRQKIQVIPIPGVSSITAAMSISGFDDKFLFIGFLPKSDAEIEKVLKSLCEYNYSQIFFIPAIKINSFIKKFKQFFSGRKIMIGRELTKIHETFYRDEVDKIEPFKKPVKGELTVIISDKKQKKNFINRDKIIHKARKYLKKYSLKDTVDLIFEIEKVNKKEIYQICLKIKNEKNS